MRRYISLFVIACLLVLGYWAYTRAAEIDSAYGSGKVSISSGSTGTEVDPNDIEIRISGSDVWYKDNAPLGDYVLSQSEPSKEYDIYIRNNTPEPDPITGVLPSYQIRATNVTGEAQGIDISIEKATSSSSSPFPMGQDLSASDASFIGEARVDYSGYSVSNVGDVDGDDFDDFIIGAFGNDDGENYAGKTYLFFGKAGGWAMDTSLSSADVSFTGVGNTEHTGRNVSGVGDVNNDGYDDFAIGAAGNDEVDEDAGKAYLIFGKGRSSWDSSYSLSQADASFLGESKFDYAGREVSGVGDVNNDSIDDFMISAYGFDYGGQATGKAYLVLGKSSGWGTDVSLASVPISFVGEGISSNCSGVNIAGVGDVNGDHKDDILLGFFDSLGNPGKGKAYLILGKSTGWTTNINVLSESIAAFVSEGEKDLAGESVAGVGDVNGDGYDDFVIGAPCFDASAQNTDAGKAYLFLGDNNRWSPQSMYPHEVSLSTATASFFGEAASNYAGHSISGVGDVNNDGFDDFIVGAYGSGAGGFLAGQTYLLLGKASGWTPNVNLSGAEGSFVGESEYDQSGRYHGSISGAGDVNGDGYDDLLIGAYGNSENGDEAGQTYLILGKPSVADMDSLYSGALSAFVNPTDAFNVGYLGWDPIRIHIMLTLNETGLALGEQEVNYQLEIFGN